MRSRIQLQSVALALILGGSAGASTLGQTPKSDRSVAKAKAAAKARKIRASQLIDEVVSESKLIDDAGDRAEIQAKVAQVLCSTDHERALQVFRQAWGSAVAADDLLATQPAGTKSVSEGKAGSLTEARGDVLGLATRCDRELGEALLRELVGPDAKGTADTDASGKPSRHDPMNGSSRESILRLELARQLLALGDTPGAIQVAAPVVNEGVSGNLINFLAQLWTVDMAEAERLYVQLIARVGSDSTASANDVLVLSTPIVSPGLLVVVDDDGGVSSQVIAPANRVNHLSTAARQSFFRTAAEILLRPAITAGDSGRTPEAYARYYAGERLLPYFQGDASQYAEPIRLRDSTLAAELRAGWSDNLSQELLHGNYSANRNSDPLGSDAGQIDRTQDDQARDAIYLQMVRTAALHRFWDRAKAAAAKIVDIDARAAALSFIQLNQIADLTRAAGDDRETDYAGFAAFVRKADVPPIATAWGLAQTALIAKKQSGAVAATALFSEASGFAAKTENGSDQRVGAYVMLANLILQHDPRQAWFIVPDLIHAANALGNYSGFAGIGPNAAPTVQLSDDFRVDADEFSLVRLFNALAKLDFDRAADSARSFGQRLVKIDAMLAVAKVELERGSAAR